MPRSAASRHELGVLAVEQRDHRPGGEGVDLLDEVERVLVVAVDDDDRQVRVVARDGAPRPRCTLTAISVGVWPSSRTCRAVTFSAARVLVGQEDPQRALSVLVAHPASPTCLRLSVHRASTMLSLARPSSRRDPLAPQHPGARIPASSAMAFSSHTPARRSTPTAWPSP